MGKIYARTYRGKRVVHAAWKDTASPRGRADYRRDRGRTAGGHIFGAFNPHTGEAFTHPYTSRGNLEFADFLEQVDAWLPGTATQVVAVLDNLNIHRSQEVLLFLVNHPRWELAFIPSGAAYLNLIEPWWKTLRSLALKGRRFETWEDVKQAIREATQYWNRHRHAYKWGERKRHQPPRPPGIAAIHKLAG
jgi:transposase